jgi:putative redox protein
MTIETVRAKWIEDQIFLLNDHSDFPIIMTQPAGVHGAGLLPMSLIGCAAWDVQSILHKQHQQLTHFELTSESERDEDPPWRFRRIRICYKFRGHNLDEKKIKSAIELSEQKYCPVYAILRDVLELTSEVEIMTE